MNTDIYWCVYLYIFMCCLSIVIQTHWHMSTRWKKKVFIWRKTDEEIKKKTNLHIKWHQNNSLHREKHCGPTFVLHKDRQHSLCDFGCQQVAECIRPDDCQIPAAVRTLLSSIGPAQLPRDYLKTAWRLGVVHPVFWTVRGGWRRTDVWVTPFPRLFEGAQHQGNMHRLFYCSEKSYWRKTVFWVNPMLHKLHNTFWTHTLVSRW